MVNVISLARTFGKQDPIGKIILEKEGHKLYFTPEEQTPLDDKRISALIKELKISAIVVGATKITPDIISALGPDKIIAKHGVGLDNIDVEYATQKNTAVTFTPEANVQAVAELTIGLIFSIARKIPLAFVSMKDGKWQTFMGKEVNGKTDSTGESSPSRSDKKNVDAATPHRNEPIPQPNDPKEMNLPSLFPLSYVYAMNAAG